MMVFDLQAKFASFKKFYTNSSSLTYLFPPRTVISGIIGAILGFDFDSYYEDMNFKNSLISVSVKSKIRTYMTNLNYMKIIDYSFFNNIMESKGYDYTQIPFELLIPEDFSKNIVYRIYFSSKDETILELKEKIKNKNPYYPVSLGYANMLATVRFVAESEVEIFSIDDFIEVVSPTPLKYINCVKIEEGIHIQKDIIPIYFDKERRPRTETYIFEHGGKNYKIKTDRKIIKVKYNNNEENMVLPEVAENEFLFS
ncbi:CRISPR-associated protein Cas5h [Picrophilus oshimae DSM 9789]|uniref:CRISPR-associated protein Cas5h n=2 Tax=Picrophilus oshimae TaxID=46632 RepID=A0A8G2L8F8_PICTO|nr:CRISPR-associated protein Cas5h [Picrophilus oshimae DSM 9789]